MSKAIVVEEGALVGEIRPEGTLSGSIVSEGAFSGKIRSEGTFYGSIVPEGFLVGHYRCLSVMKEKRNVMSLYNCKERRQGQWQKQRAARLLAIPAR